MTTRGRGIALAFSAIVVLVVVVLASAGGTPEETDPQGTLAFRRLLTAVGFDVSASDTLPPIPGTLILLSDLRSPEETGSIFRWVAEGGHLVVADPASTTVGGLGVAEDGRIGGLAGTSSLPPECAVPEAVGVERIEVRATDRGLSPSAAGAVPCFGGSRGAFEVVVPLGEGRVALLGGISPLTNELLAEADNAAFAVQLADRRGPVVFGPPLPLVAGGADPGGGLWDLLPDGAKVVLVQIGLAAIAFAVVRGRRLGKPVLEERVSPIPAGELVRATAELYRSAKATGFAGRLLRRGTAARLARRVGAGPGRPEELPGMVSRRADLPEERARQALEGPDPTSDQELLALGHELEEVRRRVEGATSG